MSVLTLPQSMVRDQENQIKANAAHVDENFTALETAVNGKLDLDGSSVPTADISMGSHKLTNVATPSASGDVATKGYVDSADTALAATCVKLSGNQTIAGTKTFSSSPVIPAPTNNTDASTKKYVDDSITTLSNACVKLSGNQTIAGTKTFSSTISGSITGNAGTVTNGVYTTGNQTIAGTKTFSSTISGSITGNAGTVTNGVYTTGNQTIGGTKTFSSSPVLPTPTTTDNSTKGATTAFVKAYAMGLPDWSNPTQITANSTWVATANGYVCGGQDGGGGSAGGWIKINNNFYSFHVYYQHTGAAVGTVPVAKGDAVTVQNGTYYFIPCKNL